MADTWVNLVQPRLPTPTANPPKKPELRAVAAPTSPSDTQKSDRASRKDFGWFWITKKRNTGPLTFARPSSFDATPGALSRHELLNTFACSYKNPDHLCLILWFLRLHLFLARQPTCTAGLRQFRMCASTR
jgi:hypothetical protein